MRWGGDLHISKALSSRLVTWPPPFSPKAIAKMGKHRVPFSLKKGVYWPYALGMWYFCGKKKPAFKAESANLLIVLYVLSLHPYTL